MEKEREQAKAPGKAAYKEAYHEGGIGVHFVDGKTRVCGVIGCPVEHTLSPLIHNTLAALEGRNMVYVPLPVKEEGVKAAVRGAYEMNFGGLNVTVPHKSKVMDYLTEVDELAEQIGAVNTLVPDEGGYKGYNTDMPGLYRAMESEGIRLQGEDIILLGAGGAARAVAYLCAQKGANKIYLLNRTLPRAKEVAREVNNAFGENILIPMQTADYAHLPEGRYLAIQATSVGLHPDVNSAVIEEPAFYEKIHTGYDLIYKPARTKFMSYVEKAGGKAYNGLKMLLYQAVIAYELWNDTIIDSEKADAVYETIKKAMETGE